jgi:hypothetical protein
MHSYFSSSSPLHLFLLSLYEGGSVSKAMYVGDRVQFLAGLRKGLFLFIIASTPAVEPTEPPIQWIPEALSVGVKRTGREADHSPPFSAEDNHAWSYAFTPPHIFTAWYQVKHGDNFTLTFHLYWLKPLWCVKISSNSP